MMKRLFFLAVILCASLMVNAQTNPGCAVLVTNISGCDYYVSVIPRNLNTVTPACGQHPPITVFVPAHTGVAQIPGFNGVQYEIAFVSYLPPTQGPGPLAKVKTPYGTVVCPSLGNYPQCDDWIDQCNGIPAEICWGGTPVLPTLQINN